MLSLDLSTEYVNMRNEHTNQFNHFNLPATAFHLTHNIESKYTGFSSVLSSTWTLISPQIDSASNQTKENLKYFHDSTTQRSTCRGYWLVFLPLFVVSLTIHKLFYISSFPYNPDYAVPACIGICNPILSLHVWPVW